MIRLKTSLCICMCIFLSTAGFSQINVKEMYYKGTLTLGSGQTMDGYVYQKFENVSLFQNVVRFISPESYYQLESTGKLKPKLIQKYKPKEIQSYSLEDGRVFKSAKYADLTAVGAASIPKIYCLEQLVDGKIQLFKMYIDVGVVVTGETAILVKEGGKALEEYQKTKFELLLLKDEKILKNLSNIKLQDYISDNQEVLDKFNTDEYGDLKLMFSSRLKPDGFTHNKFEYDLIRLLNDYNQ